MERFDVVIVGGGIVGLATALDVQRRQPMSRVLVLEKETQVARHQTGRNSGVIHAGVYYAPGSLKARFCADGKVRMREYCEARGISYEMCGKLIVAVNLQELERLKDLEARARENSIDIVRLTRNEARALEPAISSEAALLSPSTGIVDFAEVARRMAADVIEAGGEIRTGNRVIGGSETEAGVTLETARGKISAGKAVFCAGLWADRIARQFGADVPFRIIPFRGEYFRIRNQPADMVRHLIYPVPDPARPFLGVHLTRKMDGGFTVGPNAVMALSREGYERGAFDLRELVDTIGYPGFWRLIKANAGSATSELSASLLRRLYLKRVQAYCPKISLGDLERYRPGIRAQAVWPDGRMVEDFLFLETRHTLHVCNAPSPAATSALPIGEHIGERLLH
jgi:L-2-hydroxyglutarate oxidase